MSGTVLLLMPPDRQVTGAIAKALDLAAERDARLVAAVVVDEDAGERLSSRIADRGVLGDGVTDRIAEAVEREHRIRAEALLREVADQARTRGLTCTTLVETGDPSAVCRRLVATERASVAVVVVERRSWLARMLSGGQPLEPVQLGGSEVVLVDED